MRRLTRTILLLAIILCAALLVFTLTGAWQRRAEELEGEAAYLALVPETGAPAAAAADTAALPEQESSYDPAPELGLDFEVLEQAGSDIIGWLYCEGTVINYPVVQGRDNSYYLTHLYDGTYNRLGTIFMDVANSGTLDDHNTVLYGHHMASGRMLASIVNYKDQSYYEEHPLLYLYTPQTTYRIEVFAGVVTEGSTGFPLVFETPGEHSRYLRRIRENSTFQSDVEMGTGDKMITFSTCDYTFNDARYALFGKLIDLA